MTVLWWIISGTIAVWFLLNGAVAVILAFKGRQRLRPNFVHGLLRLWLVLSLCWVGYTVILTRQDLPAMPDPALLEATKRDTLLVPPPFSAYKPILKSADDWPDYDPTKDRHSLSYLPTEQDRQDAIIDGVKWALIPPVVLLAAGIMIGWIIRGFGRRERAVAAYSPFVFNVLPGARDRDSTDLGGFKATRLLTDRRWDTNGETS